MNNLCVPKGVNPETLCVLYHPVGSANSTDGGRDAAALSEALNIAVLAVDRPGSGLWLPSFRAQDDFAEPEAYANRLIEVTEQQVDKAQEIMRANRLIVVGRSAGALAALAVARDGHIAGVPISTVYAAEPPGSRATTVADGFRGWKEYKKREAEKIADVNGHPELERPEPTDARGVAYLHRTLAMVPHFLNDKRANQQVWAKLVVPAIIDSTAPGPTIKIDYAIESMVLSENVFARILYLDRVRHKLLGRGDLSSVEEVPHTVHRSFDNRRFFAKRLASVIDSK